MLKRIYFIALLGCVFSLQAQTVWKTTAAGVMFTIKNAGLSVNGKFTGFTGDVTFSPESLNKAKIIASVDANTINTGIDSRNKHLRKEDYLNVTAYPAIVMQSKFFVKAVDGTYRGYFKLTLKGVTKDVMIPFIFEESDNKGIITGSFKLNRLDYGVGGKSVVLSDEVTIAIKLNLEKI